MGASLGRSDELPVAVRSGDVDKVTSLLSEGHKIDDEVGGWSLLHHAVNEAQMDMIILLLNNGADVNVRSRHETPLHVACSQGRDDLCCLLLNQGMYVLIDLVDNEGKTPLWRAVEGAHAEVVQILLDSGADPSRTVKTATCSYDRPLWFAVRNDSALIVDVIVTSKKVHHDVINASDGKGNTALHMAVTSRSYAAAVVLVRSGRIDRDVRNKRGETPVYLAVSDGHVGLVNLFIQAGHDLNIKIPQTHNMKIPRTPLLLSVIKGHDDVTQALLLGGANPDISDVHLRSPLAHACTCGRYQACQLLVEGGCDVNPRDRQGDTPLICASKRSNTDICKLLIHAGADVNVIGRTGKTSLHHAAERNLLPVVKELLRAGAKFVIQDDYHLTALHYSLSSPSPGGALVAFYILQHGHPTPEVVGYDFCHVMCSMKATQRRLILPLLLEMGWWPRSVTREKLMQMILYLCDARAKDALFRLQKLLSEPLSLMKQCRRVIRLCVVYNSDFTSIIKNINQLNLPDDLKYFLLFKDVEMEFSEKLL